MDLVFVSLLDTERHWLLQFRIKEDKHIIIAHIHITAVDA